MKELKPKLILPGGKGRRRSSFKEFLIILFVFIVGVFVGITIGGMREMDDSNGKTVVEGKPVEKGFNAAADKGEQEILKNGRASSENDFINKSDEGSLEIASGGNQNIEDFKKPPTDELTGVIKQKDIYTVQVGAFKQIERAQKAQMELTSRGYDPYVIQYVNSLGETWFLVRIGKFASRNKAEEFAIRYKRSEEMDAFVEELDM